MHACPVVQEVRTPARIIGKPNRLECAHTEQSQLSEGFCGKQYSSDCTGPTGCSPVRNRLALALEPGMSQATPPKRLGGKSFFCDAVQEAFAAKVEFTVHDGRGGAEGVFEMVERQGSVFAIMSQD